MAALLAGWHLTASPRAMADYAEAVSALSPILNYRLDTTNQVPPEFPALNSGSLGAAFNGEYQSMSDSRNLDGAILGDADKAVSIAGASGQQIVIPYSPSYNPSGDFSIEFWAKPANTDAGARAVAISMVNGQNAANSSDRSGWVVRQNGTDWQFFLGDDHSDGSTFYATQLTAPGAVVLDSWQHIVAVYAGSAVSIYVNGEVAVTDVPVKPVLANTLAPLILGDRG